MSRRERHRREYRHYIRKMAKAKSCRPICVVDGAKPPTYEGASYYWETPGGTRIHHPSAYRRAGGWRQVYVASTVRVEVGRDWLAAHNIPIEVV